MQPGKWNEDQARMQKDTAIVAQSGVTVCHPLQIVLSVFDKTFQILDVLLKAELPEL